MTKPINLSGLRFGRLVVENRNGTSSGLCKHALWLCKCDCGNAVTVSGANLRTGHTQSCGCFWKERHKATKTTHGHTPKGAHSSIYNRWMLMMQRCTNPKDGRFSDYGGRGIKVCYRWWKFENFLADMGEPPPGMTLDRYPNNDGNYEPGNCRWATAKEQANNRRVRRDSVSC